jgi:hypothetical protein
MNTQPTDLAGPGVIANYSTQRIPRYRNNPLIEALPPSLDDDELIGALQQYPDFDPEQRGWPTHERTQLILGLANFTVPLEDQVRLAYTMDSMVREGYVGRAPRTAEHTRIFQQLYENQKANRAFSLDALRTSPQLSTALIGPPGNGKTSSVKRVMALKPPVIFHPDLALWQIPYLHVEAPHDGASVKGLAYSILRQIDCLIPDARYYETYALRAHPSDRTLMDRVARVLHMHAVGMLIIDEIQNLANAPRNKQTLMTLLVSASNELQVPILFVGTNKARRVLNLDVRQARRSVGYGVDYWDRLHEAHSPDTPGQWEDFLTVLWHFQWTRNPVPLNPSFAKLMYRRSQGIIDIAIKLFAASQWRAMLDGSETLTLQLIEDVANKELAPVAPIIDALAAGNESEIDSLEDIAPIGLENLMDDAKRRFEGKRVRGASVKPGDSQFAPQIAGALTRLGVEPDQADSLADTVEKQGRAKNVLDGMKEAVTRMQPPRTQRKKPSEPEPDLELESGDLRRAIRLAAAEGTTVFDQLEKLHMLCDLNQVLHLE